MMRLPPLGFVLPVLSALGVALLLLPEGFAPAARQGGAVLLAASAGPVWALPPPTDAAMVQSTFAERPLLAENRQPPQGSGGAEPVPQAGVAAQPASLVPQIAGLMSVEGETRVLLRHPESGSESWARVGDTIGDWTLVEITQMAAILEAKGAQVTIQLFQEGLP